MPHLVVIKWFYWVLSSCFILKCFDMFTCLFMCFKNFVCQWFGLHDWCICWLLDGKLAVGIEGKCSSVFIQSFILFSTQAVRQTLLCYVEYKKLSYRRGTTQCDVSVEILPVATRQCRNYLYDKS